MSRIFFFIKSGRGYQNHEQENEISKGGGGAVGLTDNPAALKHWMVARSIKE